jgi:hypothetical protein
MIDYPTIERRLSALAAERGFDWDDHGALLAYTLGRLDAAVSVCQLRRYDPSAVMAPVAAALSRAADVALHGIDGNPAGNAPQSDADGCAGSSATDATSKVFSGSLSGYRGRHRMNPSDDERGAP